MVFIIAEIGVNWDGDVVKDMMTVTKKCGCNAVKFQAFQEEMIKNHHQKERLIKSSISELNIDRINELADNIGIEWFCTPMYPGAVKILDPYVKRYKIRVADSKPLIGNSTSELLDEILKTDKEIIVSCMSSPRDTKFYGHPRIRWLYCVPKYPCDFDDLDFHRIKDFDGYSNHCPHMLAPLTAVILGAEIIEIHITSNKSRDFIDNNVSFDYEQLDELVKNVRLAEKINRR